jgi:hypothetical protein
MTTTSAMSAASAMAPTTIATVSKTPLFKSHPFPHPAQVMSPDGHMRLTHMPCSEGYFAQEGREAGRGADRRPSRRRRLVSAAASCRLGISVWPAGTVGAAGSR